MGDQASPDSGDEAVPFTGKILLVNADGTLTPIVDGLISATSLDITGDTAYVTSLIGQVLPDRWLSAIAPLPAAAPTEAAVAADRDARAGSIAPPNTGLRPRRGGYGATPWAFALAALMLGSVAVAGAAWAAARRSSRNWYRGRGI